jgi:predicted ferric reductase
MLTSESITIAEYSALDELYHLRLPQQIHGEIAFACLTLLVMFSIAIIRANFYEFFYKIHIFLYLVIVVNVGMHQPVLAVRVVPIVSTLGTLWCIDRLIRTVRMLYYSQGNNVSLIPLPNGSTRVVFKRHINCDPGSHAFVWIPAIRAFETHPFTIASATHTEFVVRKQTGFTADLHEYAQKNPTAELRAFFDGPYGAVPNFRTFEKVVLLAGGSGASFTFAVALDFITQTKNMRTKAIDFVWVVKEECKPTHPDSCCCTDDFQQI